MNAIALAPLTSSVAAYSVQAPVGRLLNRFREASADAVVARHLGEAWRVSDGVQGGDADARSALAGLVTRAVGEMAVGVAEQFTWCPVAGFASLVDGLFHAPDGREIMDGDDVDPATRTRVMGHLDAINRLLGNYDAFYDVLRPHLRDGSRVLDLAAGHGGFAIAAARRARAEGLNVEFVATDCSETALELGRKAAGDLPVRFEVQDALDLSNRARGEFDVVICTQALHHFGPGQVAVMVAEATRVASRRVVFLDGARCAMGAVLVTALGALLFGDAVWAHDTWMSFRRFFVPEELRVIARLAVPHRNVACDWVAPGHCRLVVTAGG